MIRLAQVIDTFEAEFLAQYRDRLTSEHMRALAAMKQCRTQASPKMQVQCTAMRASEAGAAFLRPSPLPALSAPREPAVAGTPAAEAGAGRVFSAHLHLAGRVPGAGLGAPERALRSADALRLGDGAHLQPERPAACRARPAPSRCCTRTRAELDFHPHVHLVMPAAALDGERKRWRTKRQRKAKAGYLFNHKALAKVFRAKMLAAIEAAGLDAARLATRAWVVDCKSVGTGEQGAHLSRALSLPRRHPREGHRRLRQRPGELPLSQRQDRQVGTSHRAPARISCGWSCSTCCPRASAARATSAFCIPTASA